MTADAAITASLSRARARHFGRLGPLGLVAACVILVAVVTAVVGPFITPHDPNTADLSMAFVGPSADHWLGFDGQGRDLLSRLVAGSRSSLLGPMVVVGLSMTVGLGVALTSTWFGGWLDSIVAAVLEIMFSFPGILLAMLAAAVFGAGPTTAVLALSVAYVPYAARVLRSVALAERGKPYVQALEIQGFHAAWICLRHIVPNMVPIVVAQATLFFGYAMVDLAILSFFGLGVQFPDADWGVMVGTGQPGVLQGYPAEAFAAGGCVVLLVIAFNVLGERLADGTSHSPQRRFRLGRRERP